MTLTHLSLQNFRNHTKRSFDFTQTTIILGKNTIGKTNILEAIYFLSSGKSFRAEKDIDTVKEGEEFAKIEVLLKNDSETESLSLILSKKNNTLYKKYLINTIPRRQADFTEFLLTVLFEPRDIETITASPGRRRRYLDLVLSQAHKKYKNSLSLYEKALKHRNKMLYLLKEGKKTVSREEFDYWDALLIEHGNVITKYRQEFLDFINSSSKSTFEFNVFYDTSIVSKERLAQYFEVEQKTGITLVGPQRDDFFFFFPHSQKPLGEFGSRGEQRLTILQPKLLEIQFLENTTGQKPLLLLDDIFSELDSANIEKILPVVQVCQSIITTTHKEFIPQAIKDDTTIIELSKE